MALVNYECLGPSQVIRKYGKCLELVPLDKHFENISVGLYVKNKTCTVWSFSNKTGTEERVAQIRNLLVDMGGLEKVHNTNNQAFFACGEPHNRALRFLMSQAVNRPPDSEIENVMAEVKDTKSNLKISPQHLERDGSHIYSINLIGEHKNKAMRMRMIIAGFLRYGEMDKISDNEIAFSCRKRHDGLIRLLTPYSRNISSVETMMAAEDMRGQMTTSTLGFSQT